MNIISTQYTLENKTLEIYISGCYGNCYGCHNPELKNFNIGENYIKQLDFIKQKICECDYLIDNIWILGGEPLDQNEKELINLLKELKTTNKNIWLFTRYELDNISDDVKNISDYIKTGIYDELKLTNNNIQYNIKLASSNQNIYKKGKDYCIN